MELSAQFFYGYALCFLVIMIGDLFKLKNDIKDDNKRYEEYLKRLKESANRIAQEQTLKMVDNIMRKVRDYLISIRDDEYLRNKFLNREIEDIDKLTRLN